MSDSLPACPECQSEFTYESGALLACPMCGHEWSPDLAPAEDDGDSAARVIKDAVGNVLADGVGDHDIDCKVDGFGAMQLKSSVVKKA